MTLPFDLDHVRRRTLMHLPSDSYDAVASFLLGIDAACHHEFLEGFHDWLVPIVNSGDNLHWTMLVLWIAFPKSNNPRATLRDQPSESLATECLFRCLEEFLRAKQEEHGLDSIRERYNRWLKNQES